VIPEAAVEAAARAYYEASLSPMEDDGEGPIYTPMSWERMDGAYRNATYVFPMRLALEAAAPHMRQAFFLEMNLRAVKEELNTPFRKATYGDDMR